MKANMNSEKGYASETSSSQWSSINWNIIEKKVTILQARIVKAYKAKQYRKVRSLQWTLTHSYAARLLAIKRVTSNRGNRTSGIDGVLWATDNSKMKAVKSLQRKGYKPLPLRRIYIPKANGKQRPLSIPTMKDRAMQALYLFSLDPIAETQGDPNSYGFRPKRGCADAIHQCFIALHKYKGAAQWILDADIKACFDNISHEWLYNNIPIDKRILRLWLNAKIIDGKSFFHSKSGTPQGGIISPALANIVLNGLEDVLNTVSGKTFWHGYVNRNKHLINYIRYADDFIVTAKSKEFLEEKIIPVIEDFLHVRGLSLSQEKTRIVNIEEGFDFLGKNVRKYKGKLLIKPSKANIKLFKQKIAKIVSKNKTSSQHDLIRQLNPVIRGWVYYHRYVVAKRAFSRMDNFIFGRLWHWCRRRHSRKSASWISFRYFHTIGKIRWVFHCHQTSETLLKAESIPIRRYVKVKGVANPYDPLWFEYFEKRNVRSTKPSQVIKI